jgi:hypothetical protein
MKDMKDMKDMTKTKEAEETTRVKAMEKEEIAGSGIMNGINDAKTKSIGHGARKDSARATRSIMDPIAQNSDI